MTVGGHPVRQRASELACVPDSICGRIKCAGTWHASMIEDESRFGIEYSSARVPQTRTTLASNFSRSSFQLSKIDASITKRRSIESQLASKAKRQ